MKTVSVALVLCINVGVDPPDVKKPLRCARKQAWVEPNISNPQRSAQKIAQSLQKIYEKLQPRARYKSAIDPTGFGLTHKLFQKIYNFLKIPKTLIYKNV